jgi:plasmid stabilization system protein ParE
MNDLRTIRAWIAQDNVAAAAAMWSLIDEQVAKLADSKFPRRKGRVSGTFELVAHPNYVVVFTESESFIEVLNVIHARQKFP